MDPNVFCREEKTILHMAIEKQQMQMIDIILMSQPDINAMSKEHGTPLHVACKTSNMKVVQRLVLIGANIQATDSKGKMANNITENQKIVFLLEKYEKLQKIASQLKDESSDSELEEEQEQWLDQPEPVILETKSASLKPQIKQKMQEKKRKQSSYFIEEIDEENLMDELESGDTGSILEQA